MKRIETLLGGKSINKCGYGDKMLNNEIKIRLTDT